jgi:copine 4/6/7
MSEGCTLAGKKNRDSWKSSRQLAELSPGSRRRTTSVSFSSAPAASPARGGGPPTDKMFAIAPTPVLASRVELRFAAKGLPALDLLSANDCYVAVSIRADAPAAQRRFGDVARGAWHKIGKTETAKNCSAPSWLSGIALDYFFEEAQPLRFEVWDDDGKGSAPDFVGSVETTLGRLMAARGCSLTLALHVPGHAKARGELTVFGAEFRAGDSGYSPNDLLRVAFAARELDKKDFFGSSDP